MGDLHLPEGAPAPAVVMAHGIGADRNFGLDGFARTFRERGMAVLVFDYRHLGESPGEPRYLVSPRRQIEDYQAAIRFVRSRPEVDPDRIALWGTSFSGGHVLEVAARDGDLRAVVSQIPFVSGVASTLAYPLRYHLPAIALGLVDAVGGLLGREPITVPVVRRKGLALLASPDSWEGYRAMVPADTTWPGRVPARVFLEVLRYHPGRRASGVRAPTLFVGATDDAICPIGATRRTARRTPNALLEEFPVGHFDPYRDEWFERIAALEADFLEEHLGR